MQRSATAVDFELTLNTSQFPSDASESRYMEVWSGPINGVGDPSQGRGISLLNPSPAQPSDLRKDANLSLRAFVNPTLIPYYARTGPTLEAHITHPDVAEWWKTRLLSGIWGDNADELGSSIPIQCPTGVLLAVEDPKQRGGEIGSRHVTDILVYGILGPPSLYINRPRTPPPSSSQPFSGPDLDHNLVSENSGPQRELQIYAVTICSALIMKAESLPTPPLSPEPPSSADSKKINFDNHKSNDNNNEPFAEFLPLELESPCPKRKRIASLFDAATEYHKRVRRKGGAAVAQLMSRNSSSAHQLAKSGAMKIKKEPVDCHTVDTLDSNNDDGVRRPRTLSFSRITGVSKEQPLPAAAPVAHMRTSSMSSRRSTPAPAPASARPTPRQQDSQISLPQADVAMTPTSLSSEIIGANKALLTRTILTCMRLYGFHRNSRTTTASNNNTQQQQQQQKGIVFQDPDTESPTLPAPTTVASQLLSKPPTAAIAADTDEDEGFKAMYHATYRAASFALRRYLKDGMSGSGSAAGSLAAGMASSSVAEGSVRVGVPVLKRGKATDLVDGVLRLFCET
ncbi:hypothetical protein PAAG_11647 [Paracoccidioides lutzii Pb01]|uniref:Sld7 C-terminal domain-containing protein n=1 Tax=Paracoccidioides lutzii (strain ATCC MYA-826 / Pb01) TaxID=502779 RepID=A0A0A2V1M0_PARBA|nr:hypothetical protein PAAG_11647 [Paracoccidioides lutzii Pb01]KGQ01656.1 hypothetical protein PAAG_11647 [Paracoccidioides lutzii Pb01]